MWKQQIINTKRGTFELFTKGNGEPLCITHHYSQFNETGDYFADVFTSTHRVLLINLRDAGNSVKAKSENELRMIETVHDLEAIREALQFPHGIWLVIQQAVCLDFYMRLHIQIPYNH